MQDLRFGGLLPLVLLASQGFGPRPTDAIRLNQTGFYPGAPKAAFIVGAAGETFRVLTTDLSDTAFTGRLGPPRGTALSSDTTRAADFSALRTRGRYVVLVPGLGASHPFAIQPRMHEELVRAALKAFYFQRASLRLEPRYAGNWSRPAGHADTRVLVHPSAASDGRPAGTVISSSGGWYDAGDYNKYIVNSGITVATLFSLYEDFSEYVSPLHVNIPESGDAEPDLLNEALWNLLW